MKSIKTLVSDIYALFGSGHKASPDNTKELAEAIAQHVNNALAVREPRGTLRASIIGTKCKRKLWYDVNKPELAEELNPWTKLMFLKGNIWEEILLYLGQEAGHKIDKRQHEVKVNGITGHIDAIVDGVVTDVKSASGYGMGKFENHELRDNDPFGYLKQITFYKEGLRDDPAVSIKGEVAFLAADKSNGRLCVDTYKISDKEGELLKSDVDEAITMVASDDPPARGFFDVADGASGNRVLCMECGYCPYKNTCWSGLRKFIYSNKIKYFTKVVKEPKVPEIYNNEIKEMSE